MEEVIFSLLTSELNTSLTIFLKLSFKFTAVVTLFYLGFLTGLFNGQKRIFAEPRISFLGTYIGFMFE